MADDKNADNQNIADMNKRLRELQRENAEMKQAISQIAQANMLSTSVDHGFESVIAALQPLRELTPRRESVPQATADAVKALFHGMQGVTLTGGSLGIPEANVLFIGEPQPSLVLGTTGTPGAGAGGPGQQLYARGHRS